MLVVLSRTLAPILPFLSEGMYQNLIVAVVASLPDSVHPDGLAGRRSRAVPRRAAGTGDGYSPRSRRAGADPARQAGIRVRQPLGPAWIAIPERGLALGDELLFAEEINVKDVEVIADRIGASRTAGEAAPAGIGKRLGPAIPAVMAAAVLARSRSWRTGRSSSRASLA